MRRARSSTSTATVRPLTVAKTPSAGASESLGSAPPEAIADVRLLALVAELKGDLEQVALVRGKDYCGSCFGGNPPASGYSPSPSPADVWRASASD